jgi:formylglycine-generating enzyme required for sulfatase activity
MVVVPAGHFMMGAAEQEQSSNSDDAARERPRHEVGFERSFAVGVFAITRDEFEAFVRRTNTPMGGGCNFWDGSKEALDTARSFRDPHFSGGPQAGDHPVVCVSVQEAGKFATWLSGKTGHRYRLLSEAEREYVTRAGTTTAFWWGPSISADQANYWSDQSYNGSPTTPARFTTLPVKFFRPNPWGLYQVHGNVTEWVTDCPHPDYTGAPSDGSAWQMDAGRDCKERLARSGSFMNSPIVLRSAQRRFFSDLREISIGFRVAQTLAN